MNNNIEMDSLNAANDREMLQSAISQNRPLLIRNALSSDILNWQAEDLVGLIEREKEVLSPLRSTPLDATQIDFQSITQRPDSFCNIIKSCINPADPNSEIYVPGLKLHLLPKLKEFSSEPDVLAQIKKDFAEVFVGRNTQCVGHFHPYSEAMLTQISGEKHVRLYSPEQFKSLAPFPVLSKYFNRSLINFYQLNRDTFPNNQGVDLSVYPQVGQVESINLIVRPGDVLFIPVHWLHVTQGAGWNMSIAYFWSSSLKNWKLNYPASLSAINAPMYMMRRIKQAVL